LKFYLSHIPDDVTLLRHTDCVSLHCAIADMTTFTPA